MTKKNVSIPTSLEAQIRTRARNLPVDKCFISKDWKQTKVASILIVRRHINRNITMGNYLVDLKLRGVKDCSYCFNELPRTLEMVFTQYPDLYEECEYNLAHNIIYAGIGFAEDYGFEPQRNFKTAQYILEEDTDDIPIIEIPLGENGIPVLEVPYGENPRHEIAILQKTAGSNFQVVMLDKNGKPKKDDPPYMEVLDEIMETGVDEYMEIHKSTDSFRDFQVITDIIYLSKVYTDEEKEQFDNTYKLITNDPRIARTIDVEEYDYQDQLEYAHALFSEEKIEEAHAESLRVIEQNPDEPMLWETLLFNLAVVIDKVDEKTVKEAYARFPNNPCIKAWYGEWLAQEGRSEEVLTLFKHLPGLDALTTENTLFSAYSIEAFILAYAAAWIAKKDILHAEPYYIIITRNDFKYRLADNIQRTMAELKQKKISELSAAGRLE